MCKNKIRALKISETIINSIKEEVTKRIVEILLAELDPNQEYEMRRKFDEEAKFLGEIMTQQRRTEVVTLQPRQNQ